LGKAYEKYNLSWIEDVIPWTYTDLLKQISDESPTPVLTGEDIYLKEPFQVLCEKHAVSKIHPDLATSGGILETHKIGDMAEEYGVPMGYALCGNSGELHGECSLCSSDAEFSCAGKSLPGCALVVFNGAGVHKFPGGQARVD